MSAQSRLQGYQDGRRDAFNDADDLPDDPTVGDLVEFLDLRSRAMGRDADYAAGYHAGYLEKGVAEFAKVSRTPLNLDTVREFRRLRAERYEK